MSCGANREKLVYTDTLPDNFNAITVEVMYGLLAERQGRLSNYMHNLRRAYAGSTVRSISSKNLSLLGGLPCLRNL
jgi:hypothetical protein